MEKVDKRTPSKKHYDENKEDILYKKKERTLQIRKDLLKNREFPESISPWAKVGAQNVVLSFKHPKEMKEMLDARDMIIAEINQIKEDSRIPKVDFMTLKKEIMDSIEKKSVKNRNRRELLHMKFFPEELAIWAKINPVYVSLSFNDIEDLEKLFIISKLLDDKVNDCIERLNEEERKVNLLKVASVVVTPPVLVSEAPPVSSNVSTTPLLSENKEVKETKQDEK